MMGKLVCLVMMGLLVYEAYLAHVESPVMMEYLVLQAYLDTVGIQAIQDGQGKRENEVLIEIQVHGVCQELLERGEIKVLRDKGITWRAWPACTTKWGVVYTR